MEDKVYEAVKRNIAMYENVFTQVQPYWTEIYECSQTLNKSIISAMKVYDRMDFGAIRNVVDSIKPVMELYNNYEQMNSIALAVQFLNDSVHPIDFQIDEIQKSIQKISGIESLIQHINLAPQNYMDVAFYLQKALKTWEFDYGEVDEDSSMFEDIPEEMGEAIQNICEGIATEEKINTYGVLWQDKIKSKISTIFKYIVFSLVLPALAAYMLTPVFKTVEQIILYSGPNEVSKYKIIDKNTDIEIWNDELNQDYIEVSYRHEGETVSGYIKKSDLEEYTIMVSEGVNIDEVMLVSHCTGLMAEYWDIDESEAYKRLNEETDIIQKFVICNYDALTKMDDECIVREILREYNDDNN